MQAHEAAGAPTAAHRTTTSALRTVPPAYKRQAWLAVAALLGFVLAYVGLAAWFLYTAWRLSFGPGSGGSDGFWGYVVAACSAFLALFMIKAVFFIQRGQAEGLTELTPADQPELFRFLHELADKAGAPRPHKVFASARVNAAVFYDLSLLNLLLPSRKNLEIGMGLVNTLTLGELRAVLAHEFGHFAQRAMAVGRWVYVAHQIAANMVARRDKLDAFLVGLSRFDIRVAWVGWILQVIIWSIRSLVATAFQGVIVLQRALSREMEMQADLVAVSLTGSDALVHALLKLQAADDSWDRTLGFAAGERDQGRPPSDVFAMQQHILQRMAAILNDPLYGRVPAIPDSQPEAHRVFKAELAQPPRMWLSHPLNHEREANAKRVYLPAPIDERSAWDLFANPQALRERITAGLIGQVEAPAVPVARSLAAIDEAFDRPSLDGRYRGAYLGRSVVRSARRPGELYTSEAVSIRDLSALYPATLVHDIEQQRQLERELGQLQALHDGVLQASDNEIRYRGRALSRQQLPAQIAQVRQELEVVRQRLQAHDRLCRSAHLLAAREAGQGWEAYVSGLLAALHYADHTEADLTDLQGVVGHTFRIVTATGKVSDAKLKRLIEVCNTLQGALARVFEQRQQVKLDVKLLALLETDGWADYLGELALPPADRQNINDWLKVVDGWVAKAAGACGALRRVALDELLATEAMLARHVLEQGPAYAAPAPSVLPEDYATLPLGEARQPEDKLDWWARFQTADGKVAAAGRLLVAGAIVASVLLMGGSTGTHHVMVYNGLGRTVVVQIGAHRLTLAPRAASQLEVDPDARVHVEARTQEGQLIEAFDAERQGQQVYSVAGASPMVVWTAVYGPVAPQADRPLGAPRWFSAHADVLFAQPPTSVSTKHGQGATRDVLQGLADAGVRQQLAALEGQPQEQARLVARHARWDSLDEPELDQWLYLDSRSQTGSQMLAQRLAESPGHVRLLRLQQDLSANEAERQRVCAAHQAQARAQADNPDWAYVAVRCMPEGADKSQAFLNGHSRWPQHPWFTYAAGYVHAESAAWPEALRTLAQARATLPAMADSVAEDEARVLRWVQGERANLQAQAAQGRSVRLFQQIESAQALSDSTLGPIPKAYAALMQARFTEGQASIGSEAEPAARWLRLAAASDQAPADMVGAALKLSIDSGMDEFTYWAAVGLTIRTHGDLSRYERLLNEGGVPRSQTGPAQARQIWRFLMAAQHGGAQAVSDVDLQGLMPQARGLAYSAAATALGERAPQAWRDAAKRLLFATERPYFN